MSFAIQFLSVKYLVEHAGELKEKLISVPDEIDYMIAGRKLSMMGKSIDKLTDEQKAYLEG